VTARLSILLVLVAALLAGCTVGPKYHKPSVSVASAFAELSPATTTNQAPEAQWWKTFHDPELDRLVQRALESNYNLQIASTRVRAARLQRNMTAADLFPQVDADGGYLRARGSKNVVLPSGASGGAATGGDPPPVGTSGLNDVLTPFGKGGLPGKETDLYQAGFDATWEIDVFGGKRRQVQAASAQVREAHEQWHGVKLSLLAEVARTYLELRGAQQRLGIGRTNLALQMETVELTRSLYHSGLGNQADVTRAAAQAESTAATLPPLEGQVKNLSHALALALGCEPSALSAELSAVQPVPATPPEVPVGLPSQLIERRPDIREAEQRIAEANALVGSAESDLLPKFALVGSAGLDSTSAQKLFEWDSRYFLISPTVSWRIFDAGKIFANIRLQRTGKERACLQFRLTLLTALKDVEDALVTYATEQSRRSRLAAASTQYQRSYTLVRDLYDHGLATFLDVLDAQRSLLLSQDALAQSDAAVATDLVALYKALGGGWQ